MIKYVFVIIFIILNITSCKGEEKILLSKNKLDEIKKIDMFNLKLKKNFLLNNLKIEKKYTLQKQKEFFKYIIIGEWEVPVNKIIKFFKDGKCILTDYSLEKKFECKWKLKDNILMIKDEKKLWQSYLIDYFILYMFWYLITPYIPTRTITSCKQFNTWDITFHFNILI